MGWESRSCRRTCSSAIILLRLNKNISPGLRDAWEFSVLSWLSLFPYVLSPSQAALWMLLSLPHQLQQMLNLFPLP